jgi:hypothetical protein
MAKQQGLPIHIQMLIRKAIFAVRNCIDLKGYNIAKYLSIVMAVNVKQVTCNVILKRQNYVYSASK